MQGSPRRAPPWGGPRLELALGSGVQCARGETHASPTFKGTQSESWPPSALAHLFHFAPLRLHGNGLSGPALHAALARGCVCFFVSSREAGLCL